MSLANERAERALANREGDRTIDMTLWREQLRVARDRVARATETRALVDTPDLDALALSLEELSVAEEELEVQHEELVATQQSAELERLRYRSLFDHAPIPYLVTDREGVITEANHAAGVMLRRRPDHLAGKPLAVFLPLTERGAFRKRLCALDEEEEYTANVVFTLEAKGVLARLVSATVGLVRNRAGGVAELRWLLTDTTEQSRREREALALSAELERRVEERTYQLESLLSENAALLYEAQSARRNAESANREKTELITRVSHELRTPLSAIGGYIELLTLGVHGELTRRQAVDIARVKTAHAHILALLDDLLSYFRLGAGQLRVDVQSVRVADALGEVLSMVTPQADAQGVRCSFKAGDEDVIIRADPERLRQIIVNLLANAIKFTPRGGSVELTWVAAAEHVEITVRDDGIGIPLDRQQAIFEPFVQLDASPGVLQGGFGLGLSISRGLAIAMAGSLDVTSLPNQGATFRLRLPRVDMASM